MEKTARVLMVFVFIGLFSNYAFAGLRCGNDLIQIGDSAYKVTKKISKCGKILAKEEHNKLLSSGTKKSLVVGNIGTSSESHRSTTLLIGTWYILIDSYTDYCYDLTFVDKILKKIGDYEECE